MKTKIIALLGLIATTGTAGIRYLDQENNSNILLYVCEKNPWIIAVALYVLMVLLYLLTKQYYRIKPIIPFLKKCLVLIIEWIIIAVLYLFSVVPIQVAWFNIGLDNTINLIISVLVVTVLHLLYRFLLAENLKKLIKKITERCCVLSIQTLLKITLIITSAAIIYFSFISRYQYFDLRGREYYIMRVNKLTGGTDIMRPLQSDQWFRCRANQAK